jgi:hypothetical protein
MPIHDFTCNNCQTTFEEVHNQDEVVVCQYCNTVADKHPIGLLADYTGINSMAVQYATGDKVDSYITKAPSDYTFLSKTPITQKV